MHVMSSRKDLSSASASIGPSTKASEHTLPNIGCPSQIHPTILEAADTIDRNQPQTHTLAPAGATPPSTATSTMSMTHHPLSPINDLSSATTSYPTSYSSSPSDTAFQSHHHHPTPFLNRAPPSTPPTFLPTLNPSAYSMPTIPTLSHPASRPDLVSAYRVTRRTDPTLFDAITHSIKDELINAKVSRGGQAYLLREEYTVELASREDAAKLERMTNREGVLGRSRSSTLTDFEIEPLPEALDGGERREDADGIDDLLETLFGKEGAAVLKFRCGVDAFSNIEEAAAVLKKAREEGKFVARIE